MITVNEGVGNRNPKAETLCSTVYQVRVAGRICIAKIPKNKQVRELELNAFRAIQARSKQTDQLGAHKKGHILT